MALIRDRCVCLRRIEYSETSQILTLFSREHGLFRAIAKGAHRRTKAGASKFDGGLDLLDVGDAVFTHAPERDLALLTEWSLQEGQLALRQNLRGIYLGLYAAELVTRLFEEHDPHAELFDSLESTLADLATPRREEAFLAFQLDVLRESGYLAELFLCSDCSTPLGERQACYFSPSRGGIVCRSCEAGVPDRAEFDWRLLRLLQGVLKLPRPSAATDAAARRLPQLTRHQTDPINRLFAGHIEHTLGRRLQVAPYVVRPPGNGAYL